MKTAKNAQKTYIEREVATASPQKLQLMLVEAAIKNIHRTKLFWENNDVESAFQSLTRAQDIVTEILCSLDMEGSPEIAQSLASIYVFIFRKIAMTRGPENIDLLDDALRVLMAERESWKEICEKFGTKTDATKHAATFDAKSQDSQKLREIKPKAPHVPQTTSAKTGENTTAASGISWNV